MRETEDRTKEYLSITELCDRITYAPKTVYNLIDKEVFKENEHYFKPRRKLLFYWPAIEQWIREGHHAKDLTV